MGEVVSTLHERNVSLLRKKGIIPASFDQVTERFPGIINGEGYRLEDRVEVLPSQIGVDTPHNTWIPRVISPTRVELIPCGLNSDQETLVIERRRPFFSFVVLLNNKNGPWAGAIFEDGTVIEHRRG